MCIILALTKRREEVSREEARTRIQAINEPYKLEILDSIKTEPITIYHIGDEWWDLCAGPHVPSTGKLDLLFSVCNGRHRDIFSLSLPLSQVIFRPRPLNSHQLLERIGVAMKNDPCCNAFMEQHGRIRRN